MKAKSKNGETTFTDDYYEKLIRGEMEDIVKGYLTDAGIPCIKVKASCDAYLGAEYGENIAAINVLEGNLDAENCFQVYLDNNKIAEDSYVKASANARKILEEKAVTGYVTVIVGTENSRESSYRESFTLNGK